MNTPTPAQALGEVMAAVEGMSSGVWQQRDIDAAFSAINFIRQHGQHFAGLEAALAMEQRHYAQAREDYAFVSSELRWQLEAAERAREEAVGLLRDVMKRDTSPRFNNECNCANHSRNAEREYENGTCPHQRIAAFLAARG